MHLGSYGPLAVRVAVVTVVLKRCLGVFLQLFGQVGARRGRGDVVSVAVVRDLELLYKAHWPVSKQETIDSWLFQGWGGGREIGGRDVLTLTPEHLVSQWHSGLEPGTETTSCFPEEKPQCCHYAAPHMLAARQLWQQEDEHGIVTFPVFFLSQSQWAW